MRRPIEKIRDSLFLKVYLTLLGFLFAVVAASALYWSSVSDRDERSWRNRFETFVERMLPASDSQAESQAIVTRLGQALDADLGLYASDGGLIASAGNPPARPMHWKDDDWRGFKDRHVMPLEGGRLLVVALNLPPWRGSGRGVLGYLLLIAAIVGAASYPVVRHLTRRLERLRRGVEAFGSGSLDTRVPVEGRDDVAAVASSFNASAERIEKLVGAHRSLLANASHELRSPLARLRMAIDLSEGEHGQQRPEILENLSEIDELVEEILLASRLDHVGRLERVERLDLAVMAAEEAARHGLEVNGEPVDVLGDARLLKRLVRNLIVNAQKHGEPPVDVSVARRGRTAELVVQDHGRGLPKEAEAHVFEPFYRPPGRSEIGGGWGLGLALVHQIATLHGGGVRYEGAQNGGARFVVELPTPGL